MTATLGERGKAWASSVRASTAKDRLGADPDDGVTVTHPPHPAGARSRPRTALKSRAVRIIFRKISNERHELTIARDDGRRETVACETRSTLPHDILHHAVEAEAGLRDGFWGLLAAGHSLADMNDRSGASLGARRADIMAVERLVGALSPIAKGAASTDVMTGMCRYAESLDMALPPWLTAPFIDAISERFHRLLGHWRATPLGAAMELDW